MPERCVTLAGDRGVEWGFATGALPPGGAGGRVLDFGPMDGFHLSCDANNKGYTVVAVGLEGIVPPRPGIQYIRQDIMTVEFDEPFAHIANVSTTEHVGLGRYGDPVGEDLDLAVMRRLREWMCPGGSSIQIMTVPIGLDAVVGQYHRVYGEDRLPKLLAGYVVLEEQYWIKADDDRRWVSCTKARALAEEPGQVPEPSMLNLSYALGGFILCT